MTMNRPESEHHVATLGATLSALITLAAFPWATLAHEIFGGHGFPASSIAYAVVLWPVMTVICAFEERPRRKRRLKKSKLDRFLGALPITGSVVASVLLAILWPLEFLTFLPTAVPTILSFLVFPSIIVVVVRRARRKRRKEQAVDPDSPGNAGTTSPRENDPGAPEPAHKRDTGRSL
jgi:amino acid transporter